MSDYLTDDSAWFLTLQHDTIVAAVAQLAAVRGLTPRQVAMRAVAIAEAVCDIEGRGVDNVPDIGAPAEAAEDFEGEAEEDPPARSPRAPAASMFMYDADGNRVIE